MLTSYYMHVDKLCMSDFPLLNWIANKLSLLSRTIKKSAWNTCKFELLLNKEIPTVSSLDVLVLYSLSVT